MSKLIFIIQGYTERKDDGTISDVVDIELIDTTPENAIKRAKKLIKKNYYRITSIIEKGK